MSDSLEFRIGFIRAVTKILSYHGASKHNPPPYLYNLLYYQIEIADS